MRVHALHSAVLAEVDRRAAGAVTLTIPRSWLLTLTEVVEAGWRACARRHHPDLGGDPRRMKQLNAAVELLRVSLAYRLRWMYAAQIVATAVITACHIVLSGIM